MGKFNYIYVGWILMTMPACSDDGTDRPIQDGNIQLSATVGDIQVNRRATAAPFLGNTYSETKPLETAIWFREKSGSYTSTPSASTHYLPAQTTVKFTRPELEYVYSDGKNLQYPTDNSTICCIGFYPANGWTLSADKISHTIDGIEDLMLSKEKEGNWNSHFTSLQFEHLLTWIKINICASSHDAVDAWGTIKQISISSASEVQVNLVDGTCDYAGGIQYISTTAEDASILLSTSMHEVGSVLCSPEVEYTVRVKSVNKNGVEEMRAIPLKPALIGENDAMVTFTDKNDARGKCFVLSLYFKPHKVLDGVCSLNAWDNQNEDIYLTGESL